MIEELDWVKESLKWGTGWLDKWFEPEEEKTGNLKDDLFIAGVSILGIIIMVFVLS